MKLNNIIWRASLIVAGAGILSFLLYKNIVPSGRYFVSADFNGANPAVSVLYPESRVSSTPDGFIINEDPVYFDVRIPRKFDTARVKVYFDELTPPVFEVGVEGLPGAKNFNFEPLQNKFLDSLSWPKVTENGITLYERQNTFQSLDDFYRHLPAPASIATYRVPFSYYYKISGYVAGTMPREIDPDILGSFKFYTYIKNEPLDFKFTFNASYGFSDISLRVFSGDKPVVTKDFLNLSGISGGLANKRTIHLLENNLPEGVYRIEVNAPKTIRTAVIVTPARYLTFAGPLIFFGTDVQKNILTSARHLYAKSSDLRPITLLADSVPYNLDIPEKRYDIKLPALQYVLKPLWFNRGNLEIDGDGLFAFDWPSFFNPLVQSFDQDLVDSGNTDFVLTSYAGTKETDGVKVGEAQFDLKNVSPSKARKIRFVLSLPQLKQGGPGARIKKIEVEFTGESIGWGWIKNRISQILNKFL